MGAAKRRGTFEQRKAAAIKRDGIKREERKRIEAEKQAAMTKEERQQHRDRELAQIEFMARCLALGYMPYIIPNE